MCHENQFDLQLDNEHISETNFHMKDFGIRTRFETEEKRYLGNDLLHVYQGLGVVQNCGLS